LNDSIDQDYYSGDHFIDINDNNRNCDKGERTLLHRGHISKDHSGGNYCFIQFWMYETSSHSPYNKWFFNNNAYHHEGDWEMVQICVKLTGTKKSEWFRPHAATASQHYYGQTLSWRINQNGPEILAQTHVGTEDNGNRVKIYIAENSHATQFRKGEIDAAIREAPSYCGTQIQYDPATYFYDCVTDTMKDYDDMQLIPLNYKDGKGIGDWPGSWGGEGGILPGSEGPAGPFRRHARDMHGNIFNLNNNPVQFHNSCRKLINGTPQIETEL
jgi:hypothetical protein